MKAANKFYIIKALGQTKETSGGIIIQRSDETELASIVSAGPDITDPYPIGTKVAVNWGNVVQITVSGEKYFIIHADSIFAEID